MQLVRAHESGGNDKATSGVADGRYQFTPQTWAGVAREHPELGLQPQDIWDGAKQDLAMRAISKDYVNVLSLNGLAPSMPNMFMLHFLGTGGGPKFLKEMQANPNESAAAKFPTEARYNPTIFWDQNKQPRSLQQVYALMTKTFGGPQASMAPIDQGTLKAIDSFDAAAGVPVGARGFSPQAGEVKTSLEEAPVGLKPLPGMTPIKDSLKPLPGMTPLNGGLKLDYNSKDPLKPAGAYTDKDGVYHPADEKPKDDKLVPTVVGIGANGEPIFAEPQANEEFTKGSADIGQAALAGLGSNVTGIGEWIPGPVGNAAAEGSKALKEAGKNNPVAYEAGAWAPAAIPAGELFMGVKEALAGGEALGATLTKMLSSGVKSGGKGGAIVGATIPTGETDTTKRLETKVAETAGSALTGAVGGGLLGGVGKVGETILGEGTRIGRILAGSAGKEADRMAEELRTGVNAKTGEAISAEDRAAHIAALERFKEKAKLAQHEDELKRITDAQAQLEERERVRVAQNRDARQVEDPEAAAKLREGVTARARERVREAENQAKEAGATETQAKEYAVEQETKALEAKTAAQEIATAYAKNPEQMSKEAFGELVQKSAENLETKAEEAREKAAGFKEAMASAPPGPVVRNDQIMKALDDIEAGSADRSVHAIVNEVRNQVKTWTRDEEGNWKIVDGGGMTVERADSLRKVLNTSLRSRTMAVEGGAADASAAQHHIRTVLSALEDATGEAHPPYNEAVKAWRDNSRGPLDEFLPKEALGKITKTQDFSGRFAMNEGRVVNEILSQSNAGSNALAVLARDNPELVGATEKYLNRQLFGLDGLKTPTAKSVTSFMEKNEPTLQKLGLYKKYADMRDALVGASKTVSESETAAKAAKDAASQAESQRKALEKIEKDRRSVLDRSKKEQPGSVFSPVEGKPEDVAKAAKDKAAADAARLRDKAAGPQAAKRETEANIKSLASEKTKAVAQKKDFEEFESSLRNIAPREAPSAAQSAAETLHRKGYITKAELDEVNRKVAEIKEKYKEADWADLVRHRVIYPLATGAIGAATGLSVHEYFSTRARAP